MITLAVTVNGITRVYPVTITTVEVNDGEWTPHQGPWLSDADSTACNSFSGIDAEHVSYLYHDGYDNITECRYANGDTYELRIDGVHDHDAIVDFFNGGFDASVSE